ncbi:MAG: molybdopterin molybdotransferase MoeA [Chloroflexota bacterium]|nr:MAG: molybdopterin molybdotransferase MoeA [Chloroflexota bacterium]
MVLLLEGNALAMISVEEALGKILDFIKVLDKEEKPLLDCLGQVLVEDVYAPFDVPPQDNSAMDGYAVQSKSIAGASYEHPSILTVIGEVAAGWVSDLKLESGTAVRIMTGAFVPYGADVVVPFEDTDEVDRKEASISRTEIGVRVDLPSGSNIRRRGEDIAKGKLVLNGGRLLCPAEIGVLASLGKNMVSVIRRPVVGILATGDEVIEIGQPLQPGKIYNSNSYSLAAQVLSYGGIPRIMGIARDNVEQLTTAIHQGFDCDILVTSGGVSLGDYDVVKKVLAAEGDISFWTVRMKPGKPLAFGTFKRSDGKKIPHLGLPGNPVSSMITLELFARPAIFKMMGRSNLTKPNITAVLEDSIENRDGRRIFARVAVSRKNGEYFARITGPQGSGILTSMMKANGLAVIPENTKLVKPGTVVEVMIFDWEDVDIDEKDK